MTLSERKSAMVKAIEGMKSEFYRNNFDKWIDYLSRKNIHAMTSDKLEATYKRCLKLKNELQNLNKEWDVKWYADSSYKPEIVMTEEEINKWEENNWTTKQQWWDDIMRTQDIDKLIKIAIAVDETRWNKLKKRLKWLDLVPKERVNDELFKAFWDTKTLLWMVIDNYNNWEWEMELPVTEKWKRPRAKRPEAWNDIEFTLTDELQKANKPSDIEYINQYGEWLQGTDDETLIRIAYPDTFAQYDSNSMSDIQNWKIDILWDSWMMKVSYPDSLWWAVYIELAYEPTESQINSLLKLGDYYWGEDNIRWVQINIVDPKAKRTVLSTEWKNMQEAIDSIQEYFGK
jgi:hypothetical protein